MFSLLINRKLFVLTTFFLLVFPLIFNGMIGLNMSHRYLLQNPKSTSDDLMIITPENKTYTAPMTGYYPATYGFENDLPGAIPEGWWTRSAGDGYYEVDSLLAGHNNVYEIRKSGGTMKVETYNIFPQGATVGTIEFWVYKDTDSGTDPTRITLRDDPTGGYIPFGIENGDLFIGAWSEKVYVYNNAFTKNVWHHIRVDFNLAIGWQLQLDDTWYGAGYAFDVYASDHPEPSQINTFHVESIYSGDNPNYGAWFDTVSYSWDHNYNIGDNLEEGLLLSFQTLTPLEWTAYYLDDSANYTIYGNTVIPMPSNGVHSIKVIGLDSLNEIHQSSWRIFSIDYQQPTPPDIPPHDNIPIILFTIFGVVSMLGTILATILIVTKPRKFSSNSYRPSLKMEERYYQPPISENLPPNKQVIQCPHCLLWDEIGGKYCPNCGGKLPNTFKN